MVGSRGMKIPMMAKANEMNPSAMNRWFFNDIELIQLRISYVLDRGIPWEAPRRAARLPFEYGMTS